MVLISVPRPPRIDIPGLIYHVTNRGVRRLPIFLTDQDRQQFMRFLMIACKEYPFRIHAYCLMTNHYHLLLQTLDHSLSSAMHYFSMHFASWFNRRYQHPGPVFQARFHSIPVQEDAYFTTVARYIHLNPVRAGLVQRPEDFAWSSYAPLIRGEVDPIADPRFILSYFGEDPGKQRENYRRFVEEGLKKDEPITDKVLQRMRSWGKLPLPVQEDLSQTPVQIAAGGQAPAV